MAESLSVNNLNRQIAREEILNNQRRESFKSYMYSMSLETYLYLATLDSTRCSSGPMQRI